MTDEERKKLEEIFISIFPGSELHRYGSGYTITIFFTSSYIKQDLSLCEMIFFTLPQALGISTIIYRPSDPRWMIYQIFDAYEKFLKPEKADKK